MPNSVAYFDITIGGAPAGRLEFELFDDVTPKTAANFEALCRGDQTNAAGVKLAYAGSGFHRCIKGFMLQGGDFTNHNGTGGESIYGEKFADENFTLKHDKPFLLSMANAGPGTNGSQFFITTVPTPHLDGKHVVFGRLRSNKGLVRRIENLETDAQDKPDDPVMIAAAGVYTPEELAQIDEKNAKDAENAASSGEDVFEDYPEDESKVDTENPAAALKVASTLKDVGTAEFKGGNYVVALAKYQKATRYLDNAVPSGELVAQFAAVRTPLLLNASLAALKVPGQAKLAISLATKALDTDLSNTDKGKALYRRALGRVALKDDTTAEEDLNAALAAVPGDAGIKRALADIAARKAARQKAEKKAYAKMFG